MPSNMKPRINYSILLLLSFFIASCKDQAVNTETTSDPSNSSEKKAFNDFRKVSQNKARLPFKPIGLYDESIHQEPDISSWKVEEFNELVGEQFKKLEKIIQNPKKIIDENFDFLLSENFESNSLTPKKFLKIFKDDRLEIVQAVEPIETKPSQVGFNLILNELIEPLSKTGNLRTKFKTFNVTLKDQKLGEALSLIEIVEENDEKITSIKSTWKCYWEWDKKSKSLKVQHIKPIKYQLSSSKKINNHNLFSDCTESIFEGVKDFKNQFNKGSNYWTSIIEARYGISLSGWHGMAIGDANGDGIDDIYVCEPGGLPNKLFISKKNGKLIDASSLSGTDFRLQSQSALFIDTDNDNDQDLIIATTLGIIFMENDGRANYTVKHTELIPESAPMSLSAADYDQDGDLDIYVGCYSLRRSSIHSNGTETLNAARPIPYHDANNGGRNVLLRNDLNWKFSNITTLVGLDQNNRRFTLAASWVDFDMDGDQDLYVANDYGRNNLYRNDIDDNGIVKFVDAAAAAGVEDMSAGMSVSWADANQDGHLDLYVSNMWSSAGNRITYQRQFLERADEKSLKGFRRHARGNSLFINSGNGTFKDLSLESGTNMGRWAWGSRFADINNDGLQDILVANGFISQPEDSGDL